jgi:S1/P1 nuclease
MLNGTPACSALTMTLSRELATMRRAFAFIIIVLLTTSQAAAWSAPGHQAIAEVAQARVSPAARAALGQILEGRNDLSEGALAAVATWPDDVRARAAHGTKAKGWTDDDVTEADDFNRDNPKNGEWHFVNLPLGAAGYPPDPVPVGDPLRAFVGPDDIVHALNQAIQVLESSTDTPGFSKRQAVRFVVHLVGDIHQPMHVTTGYYDTKRVAFKTKPIRIDDPVAAGKGGVLGDRGGNGLSFTSSIELHALWDRCLPNLAVKLACSANDPQAFAAGLAPMVTQEAVSKYTTAGDRHDWAAVWAGDSVQQAVAAQAYTVTLTNGVKHVDSHTREASVLATVTAPTKAGYTTAARTDATNEQLIKAAVRLADLLNAIVWP